MMVANYNQQRSWPQAESRRRDPLDHERTTMAGTSALAHVGPHAEARWQPEPLRHLGESQSWSPP
jgi:hypothetical protein